MQPIFAPGMGTLSLVLLDADYNGRDEIYWTERHSTSLRKVEWISGVEFTSPEDVSILGGLGRGLLARDVDLDGRVDLVFASAQAPDQAPRTFGWIYAVGPGQFGGIRTIGTSTGANTAMQMIDFDVDGDPDLFVAIRAESRVGVFENLERVPFGVRYCDPAVLNSIGLAAEMSALGSIATSVNELRLVATKLPPGAATLFLGSLTGGMVH